MRQYFKALPKCRLIANYVGGYGYYGWFFAVLLLVAQLSVQAAQYVIAPSSRSLPELAIETAADPQVAGTAGAGLVLDASALVLMAFAMIGAIILPYYIGWLAKRLPRWVISQTSHAVGQQTVYYVKQITCGLTVAIATILLFAPYESGLTNALYFTTLVALVFSTGCFWLQYKIVTHWHIPERHIF